MEESVAPYREMFAEIATSADVLVLCGDLTNFGKTREAEILAEDIRACPIPVLGVLGNHDYECGQPEKVCSILHDAGMTVLDEHREFVAAQFDEIFADKDKAGTGGRKGASSGGDCSCPPELWSECLADEAQTGDLGNQLTQLGFADAPGALDRLRAVWTSSRYKALGETSRRRFDQLVQRAVQGAAGTGEADAVLARMLDLLSTISRRSSYLALLTEYPRALERVVKVLAGSRWAAGYLISHPQLLDELLDDEALAAPFDWPSFKTQLLLSLNASGAAGNVEVQMDILRRAHHAEVFRILLLDLQGTLSVEAIGDRLSELADIIVDVTIATVWPHVAMRHREVPRFSVIA